MAVAGYEVRIKEDGGAYGSPIDVGNNLNYQFGGLDASTLYFAQVRAYDAAGNRSAWSSEVNATTATAPLATDSDALAYLTAIGVTDGSTIWYPATAYEITGAGIGAAVDAFVIKLKTDGIWTKLVKAFPMIGGTSARHAVNLKNPASGGTFNGGVAHSATGALPNGTSGYLDTGVVPSASLTNNNTHWAYYSGTDAIAGTAIAVGAVGGGATWQVILRTNLFGGSHALSDAYSGGGPDRITTTVGDSLGLYIDSVNGGASHKLYKQGAQIGATTTPGGDVTLITNPVLMGAQTPAAGFSSWECRFFSVGEGLSDTEAGDFYDAVQALQTALFRDV